MRLTKFIAVLMAVGVVITACSSSSKPAGSTGTTSTGHKVTNFAMILPGPVTDADYNAVGLKTVQAVGKELSIHTAYSESVAVVDAARVAADYVSRGFTTIAFHGTQYVSIAEQLAPTYPKVEFIIETAAQIPNLPKNIFDLGRTYIGGYYALGQLAAKATKTGTIAFLGGLDIPDFKGGANAAYAGALAVNKNIKMRYAFTGDQNDPVKARQSAQALLGQGADVLLVSLNGGLAGAVQAVKAAGSHVLFTSLHTDKHSLAPQNFLASMEFGYQTVYPKLLKEMSAGTAGSYLEMSPTNGGVTFSPVYNVPPATSDAFNTLVKGLESGSVKPPKVDLTKVTIPQ